MDLSLIYNVLKGHWCWTKTVPQVVRMRNWKYYKQTKCHGNGLIFIFCIHSLSSVVKFDKLVYTSFVVLCMSLFSMHKHILPPIREISRGAHFYVFYQIWQIMNKSRSILVLIDYYSKVCIHEYFTFSSYAGCTNRALTIPNIWK